MRADDLLQVGLRDAGGLELSPRGEDGSLKHDGGRRREVANIAERRHVRF